MNITDQYGQPYIYILALNQITPQDYQYGALNRYSLLPINWQERQKNGLYVGTPKEIPINDAAVVKLIKIPGTGEIVWVIAKT